jgi:hypothetical protein
MSRSKQKIAPAKMGRPREFGERHPLGLRVTKETKKKLTDAANASGRSQSREAEFRLEQTFNSANTLFDALDLAYGRHWTGILLALAHAAQLTGTRGLAVNSWNFEGAEDWVMDPYAYDQVVKAVNAILEAFRPMGDVSAKPVGDFAHLPLATLEFLGKGFAQEFLQQLKKPNDQRADVEIAGAARQRLADIIPRMRELSLH